MRSEGLYDVATLTLTAAAGLDVNAIVAAIWDRCAALPEDERALAEATLERLRTPNWTLEWHLPWWLAASFGVPSPIAREAVVSNVLGLMAVRLADDATDGELGGASPAVARRVADRLLAAAIAVYRPLLPADSPFWPELSRFLATWRSAAAGRGGPGSLAARGAPLKAGARAIVLLGDRPDAWPALERCLDAALTALARSDDASDWEADLEAGRWNAFVAALGVTSQRPRARVANRSRVLLGLVEGDAALRVYETIAAEARRAAVIAESIGCQPLAAHLAGLAQSALDEGTAIQAHYVAARDRMTRLLFEPTWTGGGRS